MRLAVAIIIILLMVCAALASNASKPFKIDAQSPGVWPRYAEIPQMPRMVVCYPMLIPHQKGPKRISRT